MILPDINNDIVMKSSKIYWINRAQIKVNQYFYLKRYNIYCEHITVRVQTSFKNLCG